MAETVVTRVSSRSVRSGSGPLFRHFRSDAYGRDVTSSNTGQTHLLRGSWMTATLKHYDSGVKKLLRFAKAENVSRRLLLPIDPDVLAEFVVWCSPREGLGEEVGATIKSTTIRSYVAGIKAWHGFHGEPFPLSTLDVVQLLLRSTKRLEARVIDPSVKRPPVLLQDLYLLASRGDFSSSMGYAAFAAALCAFWGIARLGELVSDNPGAHLPVWSDLIWAPDLSFVKLPIREAKTAKPGEVQMVHVQRQDCSLDGVAALEELFGKANPAASDYIFSWREGLASKRLSKSSLLSWCADAWSTEGEPVGRRGELRGHSFRIGGASLRWNLGTHREQIKHEGRWLSDSYKLYLRRYSRNDLDRSLELLRS